ncbi:DNA-directed RNA polymerase I subunit RPA34 [Spea bombifrons]|uniref:DNA-directed RNA polymerase I subunit RPA34 n=1 Tax=Spea bombifrons TaxID=233779 RepID=UPI00234973C1|nr:DNA-directed RNA polymerase I subunit RPA34 [Spea bombifrons]
MESPGGKCVFQCPLNFEPAAEYDGRSSGDPDTEIWLIKTPADFNPESFNSHRFPLSGYKKQKVKVDGIRRFYHVRSSPCENTPCRAFLPQDVESGQKLACGPTFQGIITLADGHADPSEVHPIPDRPPLRIPENLKQRYRPFGATDPHRVQVPGEETPSPVTTSTKKKKKAKKRKHDEDSSLNN